MGTYLYGAKKSHSVKALFCDEVITIHRLQYIVKPYNSFFDGEDLGRAGRLVVGRLKAAWRSKVPKYVAVIEKDTENLNGVAVYADPPSVFWYDCDKISDKQIGWLFTREKKLVVLSDEQLNQIVTAATPYINWKDLISKRVVEIDVCYPEADLLVDFYKSHSWGGTVIASETSVFVG